jgi:3-methylfumaryl-CoA hydratase
MSDAQAQLDLSSVKPGDALPERTHCCDEVQLMLYNAALWNGHRIHFDAPYAREVEGYPGLVVAGPLVGDWLGQCVEEWLGTSGRLTRLQYSNRVASYVGEELVAGGTVAEVDADSGEVAIDVFVRNQEGEVIAPGRATVKPL